LDFSYNSSPPLFPPPRVLYQVFLLRGKKKGELVHVHLSGTAPLAVLKVEKFKEKKILFSSSNCI
jgi:hypothetical protein